MTAEPEYLKVWDLPGFPVLILPQAIHATQFTEFEKGEVTRTLFGDLLGSGVFAADGDLWKQVSSFVDRLPLNVSLDSIEE